MYTYKKKAAPKRTTEIIVTIPLKDIEEERKKAFTHLQSGLTVEGFRKGKAPAEIAKKHISKEDILKEMLNDLLPRIYEEIVKKENLQPIMSPRVDLTSAKEGQDWEIKFIIAEKPLVDLGNYKEAVKKIKADNKKKDIWVPGNGEEPKKETENKEKTLNEILAAVLKETKFEISDLVVEEELNQRLSRLVDDVQKIGLTVDAYLKSKNTTIDDLKKRYRQEIEDTYKLEFVLSEIAEKEKVTVEPEEINKLLGNITNEKEREAAKQNSYYYATILRKQKTLDFLLAL